MTRTIDDIRADVVRAREEYRANEAEEKQLRDDVLTLELALDARIREVFADEMAAIGEMKQRRTDAAEAHKPATRRLAELEAELKWAKMKPGLKVIWEESDNWGKRGRPVTVVESTGKRVKIDTGAGYGRYRWVTLDSIRLSFEDQG